MSTSLLTRNPLPASCRDIALEAYHRSPHGISAAMAGQRRELGRGLSTTPVDYLPSDETENGYRTSVANLRRYRELLGLMRWDQPIAGLPPTTAGRHLGNRPVTQFRSTTEILQELIQESAFRHLDRTREALANIGQGHPKSCGGILRQLRTPFPPSIAEIIHGLNQRYPQFHQQVPSFPMGLPYSPFV